MSAFFLFDDAKARDFEPFSLTRPVGELRAGTTLIRERWEQALGLPCGGHVTAPHLVHFEEPGSPSVVANSLLPAGSVIVNSRCAVALGAIPEGDVWLCEGRPAAVRLSGDVPNEKLRSGDADLAAFATNEARTTVIAGWWLDAIWDLLRHLATMLSDDIGRAARGATIVPPDGTAIRGEHDVVVEAGACIEPFVVLDATAGPIQICRGATVRAFTHLIGPCYVGAESHVGGGRVAGSSIGGMCRVHGELSSTIFIGHANKSHDGFVGHSVIGRWANLGAGTVTSNLKNTYGPVQAWTPRGMRDTGMSFLGSLIGDHAKTAVGTRLTTGCVVGAGANLVSDAMTPKVVPPFCWGGAAGGVVYELDRFLAVAERVMARRQVALGAAAREHLAMAYGARWSAP